MKKSEEPAAVNKYSDLEFPDWSGMDDYSARITPEAAFRLCEQCPVMFGDAPFKTRDEPKCEIEFRL